MQFPQKIERGDWKVTCNAFDLEDTDLDEEPMVTSAAPIHFQLTLCTISVENRIYSFMESSTVEMGLLDQHTMFLSAADRGRRKDIYGVSYMTFIFLLSPPLKEIFQMIIQGEQFVAKKLGMVMDVYPC